MRRKYTDSLIQWKKHQKNPEPYQIPGRNEYRYRNVPAVGGGLQGKRKLPISIHLVVSELFFQSISIISYF